jgi:hypothetical protein
MSSSNRLIGRVVQKTVGAHSLPRFWALHEFGFSSIEFSAGRVAGSAGESIG